MGMIFVAYESPSASPHRHSREPSAERRTSTDRGSGGVGSGYLSFSDLGRFTEQFQIAYGSRTGREGGRFRANRRSRSNDQEARASSHIHRRTRSTSSSGSAAAASTAERRARLLEILSSYYASRPAIATPPSPPLQFQERAALPSSGSSSATTSGDGALVTRPIDETHNNLFTYSTLDVNESLPSLGSQLPNQNLLQLPSTSTSISRPRPSASVSSSQNASDEHDSYGDQDDPDTESSQFIVQLQQSREADHEAASPQQASTSSNASALSPPRFALWQPVGLQAAAAAAHGDPGSLPSRNASVVQLNTRERRVVSELVQYVRNSMESSTSQTYESSGSFSSDHETDLQQNDEELASRTAHPTAEFAHPSRQEHAYLWHVQTGTNVANHSCLRRIMRRYLGWVEQAAQDGYVEYWHYTTVPQEEPDFDVIRDGVGRLPWPELCRADPTVLRAFANQVNGVQLRHYNPLQDQFGAVFDVVVEPLSSRSRDEPLLPLPDDGF